MDLTQAKGGNMPSFSFFLCGHTSVQGATCPSPREALASVLERARQTQGPTTDDLLVWHICGGEAVDAYMFNQQGTRYTHTHTSGLYACMEVYR